MFDYNGILKLVDFGAAKQIPATMSLSNMPKASLAGTPNYMAPEGKTSHFFKFELRSDYWKETRGRFWRTGYLELRVCL